jgi:hypothetical protein
MASATGGDASLRLGLLFKREVAVIAMAYMTAARMIESLIFEESVGSSVKESLSCKYTFKWEFQSHFKGNDAHLNVEEERALEWHVLQEPDVWFNLTKTLESERWDDDFFHTLRLSFP